MLRWTKGSSAAHGVLAIFLLLLSASQGIPIVEDQEVTEQPTETTAATTSIPAPTDRRIKNFEWKSDLERPCPLSPASTSHRPDMNEAKRKMVYQHIGQSSSSLLQLAQQMLDQDLIPYCDHLPIDPVNSNPKIQELEAMNTTDAVQAMYASILRCMAYASFILDQQEIYADTQCTNNTVTSKNKWTELKNRMKFLACTFHELTPNDADRTNYFDDVTQNVLDEILSDQSICSRRLNRNCQMLKSMIHVLGVVNTYSSSQASSER